jgi:hypothetical protein
LGSVSFFWVLSVSVARLVSAAGQQVGVFKEVAFGCYSVSFPFLFTQPLVCFCLLSRLDSSKGILSPCPRVCDPVPVLVVAIGIAPPRLLSSVPRSPIAVTPCPAIGYLEPLSSCLAPPLQYPFLMRQQRPRLRNVTVTDDRVDVCLIFVPWGLSFPLLHDF